MLDKLIDTALGFVELFFVATIVNEYERAVVLRFGKVHRLLEPGIHKRWPLGMETVLKENVVPKTDLMEEQTVTSCDGHSITLRPTIVWSVEDIEKMLIHREDSESALKDIVYAAVEGTAVERTKSYILSKAFTQEATWAAQKRAEEWGIKVHSLGFKDRTTAKSHRIFGVQPAPVVAR